MEDLHVNDNSLRLLTLYDLLLIIKFVTVIAFILLNIYCHPSFPVCFQLKTLGPLILAFPSTFILFIILLIRDSKQLQPKRLTQSDK